MAAILQLSSEATMTEIIAFLNSFFDPAALVLKEEITKCNEDLHSEVELDLITDAFD